MALDEFGSEITINSNTEGGTAPAVFALGNGNYVVVWETTTGGGSIVRGQIFDADGDIVGTEFTASEANGPGVFYKDPSIVELTNGDFVVSWAEGPNQTDDGANIYARRFNASGVAQGSLVTVNQTSDGGEGEVSVAALANGGFVMAWQEMSLDIDARVFDANGNPVGSEFTIATSSQLPDIAGLPGGGFVATWDDIATSRIKGQIFNSAGASVTAVFTVNGNYAGGTSDVAVLDSGEFVIVWHEFDTLWTVKAQRYEADGDPLGGAIVVAAPTTVDGQALSASVATTPGGGFVVTWEEFPTLYAQDIYAREFDADGVPVGAAFIVNNVPLNFQEGADIATGPGDGMVIAWVDSEGAGFPGDIHLQIFDTDPPVQTEFTTVSSLHGRSATEVDYAIADKDIAALEGGGYVSVWAPTSDDERSLLGQVFDAHGNLTRTFRIEPMGLETLTFSVASLSDGGFVVTWQEGMGGEVTLAQRFDANGEAVGTEDVVQGDFYEAPGVDFALIEGALDDDTGLKLPDGSFLRFEQGVQINTIVARAFDDNGQISGAPVVVATADVGEDFAELREVVRLDNGNIAFIWQQGTTNLGISTDHEYILQVLDSNLTPVGPGVEIGSGPASPRYELVALDDGFAAFYQTGAGTSDGAIWGQFFSDSGIPVGDPHRISEIPDFGELANLEVERLAGGDFVASWHNVSLHPGSAGETGIQQFRLYAEADGDGTVNGSTGHDIVRGGAGVDQLNGGIGDDILIGGASGDQLNGGIGTDTASYSDATAGLVVDLDNLANNTGDADDDTYSSVERYLGSSHADGLYGDGGANILDGGEGNDIIGGGDGDDTLIGGTGNDTLVGGIGADRFDGGYGFDTVNYALAGAVTVNVQYPAQNAGDALGDTFSGIERVIGSSFNDVLRAGIHLGAKASANTLEGGQGSDILAGGEGDDSLLGGDGDDQLWATGSVDELDGGTGDDDFFVDTSCTVVLISGFQTGAGSEDVIHLSNSFSNYADLFAAAIDEAGDIKIEVAEFHTLRIVGRTKSQLDEDDFVFDSVGHLIVGGALGDTIDDDQTVAGQDLPTSNADAIDGAGGNDIIRGLVGNDAILGGEGDDLIHGDQGNDNIDGQGGNDRIYGNEHDDHLFGGAGDDRIAGGILDDVLDGGTGNDYLNGGIGYLDTVSYASLTGGLGVTVTLGLATAQNTIGAGIDTLVDFEKLEGSNFNDILLSLGGGSLSGLDGNDFLNANHASAAIFGGLGIDTVSFNWASAHGVRVDLRVTVDQSILDNGASSIDDTDFHDVENLEGGSQGDTFTGTDQVNVLSGFGGNDTLFGEGGNDVLNGGNDVDSLFGGNDDDVLTGGAGTDALDGGTGNDTYNLEDGADTVTDAGGTADKITSTITRSLASFAAIEHLTLLNVAAALIGTGNNLNNTITGNNFNNTLTGGLGSDTLVGGAGSDTYVVDNAADIVDENAAGSSGIDTIESAVTRSLLASAVMKGFVENLKLTGGIAINGTGNVFDNVITGNAAANVLDGGFLNDTLRGGGGNDSYIVDNARDIVDESVAGSGGIDTVKSSVTRSLVASTVVSGVVVLKGTLEHLTLTGTAAVNGTGNASANTLTGNGAANILDGGAGIDKLIGLGGNDVLIGNLGKDTMTGGVGNDVFRFAAKTHSVVGGNADIISDFDDSGNDRIDVSLLFGPALAYRHNLAFTAAGQLRINDVAGADVLVEVNTGGSLAADFQIRLTATTLASMAASDFLL